jgi:hypothetical protein
MNIQFAMPLGGMKFGIQSLDIAYPQELYAYPNGKGCLTPSSKEYLLNAATKNEKYFACSKFWGNIDFNNQCDDTW